MKGTQKNHIGLTFPTLAEEYDIDDNGIIQIENLSHGSNRDVVWKCKICGIKWVAKVSLRTMGYGKCPNCFPNKHKKFKHTKPKSPQFIF